MKNMPLFLAVLLCSVFNVISLNSYAEDYKVHAPFNKPILNAKAGDILSWIDPEKAISAVAYHKGLLITPLSFDFGGGIGEGALAAYNVDDPTNPKTVFDSRDYPNIYHNNESDKHYLGDLGEVHTLYFHKDYLYLTDRGKNRNGFIILDLGPLFDDDPKTLPKVISRFYFPGVEKSTVYDGFSFSPVWVGGKYAFAPTGSTGLYIIDTTNLEKPRLLKHLTKDKLYNQVLRSAHAIGDLLILSPTAIASTTGDMVLLDISDPSNPFLINRHTIKVGYQGILYGSRFYNGAFSGDRGTAKTSEIITYDFSDVENIKTIELATTDQLFKPEYIYVKDDDLYIGHYPGLTKWSVNQDKATLETRAEPQYPPADDYAFISSLGNLTVITSDHNVSSKLSIAAASIPPDTTAPKVNYILPKKGENNVSLLSKIGISFSDFIDNGSLEFGATYLIEKATKKVVPSNFSHGMGIVHIVPKAPLKTNTSYEVIITSNLKDTVGNAYQGEEIVTYFSTGDQLNEFSSELIVDEPKKVGDNVTFTASVKSMNSAADFSYAWNFGNNTPNTEFSGSASIQTTFDKANNYNVTLIVKNKKTKKTIKNSAIQVIYNPVPNERPLSSSTMVLDEHIAQLYVVNPDNNTLTAISTDSGKVIYEQPTGKNPVALIQIDDQLWVSNKDDDSLSIHNKKTGELFKTLPLGYASTPHGITFNKIKKRVYVALSGAAKVQEIDSRSLKLTRNIKLKGPLRNLAFLPRNNLLIAPQFIASNQQGAFVQWVNTDKWSIEYQQRLSPIMDPDGLSNGRGYPNYLGPIAVNPEQNTFWLPGKKDNLFRGLNRDGNALTFDHTVRSIASAFSLDKKEEIKAYQIDFDNSDFASAATFNKLGNILYIATMGSQTITAIDAYQPNKQSTFNSYGEGTISLIPSKDGSKLFAHNQLSRSISVFNSKANGHLQFENQWKTVNHELLSSDILQGKRIFHNSTQSHLSREGYMSCASCHSDGSHDGRIWDLSNLGEGLRNTIDLRGKSGMKHGLLHWTGNFDEVQDFNDQIVNLNGGTGFLFDAVKPSNMHLFPSKAGINIELDNLAKYVSSLDKYPRSPYKKPNGTYTSEAIEGKKHFINLQCNTCHVGSTYTDSMSGVRHDIGTKSQSSGNRLGEGLDGFDTPSLISLWQSAPYLHDGSAKTLNDVFQAGKGEPAKAHNIFNQLNKVEKNELLAFLQQLDSEDKTNVSTFKQSLDYVYQYSKKKQNVGKGFIPDIDAADAKQLSYSIISSVYSKLFSIDAQTGDIVFHFKEVYLRNISNRVLKTKRSYPLTILAKNTSNEESYKINININILFPNIDLDNVSLNKYKRYNTVLDKGKKLSKKEQEHLNQINKRLYKTESKLIENL